MVTIGTSVMRRDSRELNKVKTDLTINGWVQSGSLGDRVVYMENSGFSITLIEGPMGTVVIPSGPVRGALFGDSGLSVDLEGMFSGVTNTTGGNGSSSNTGSDNNSTGGEPPQPQRKNTKSTGQADFV